LKINRLAALSTTRKRRKDPEQHLIKYIDAELMLGLCPTFQTLDRID
jgi:hypothetical protein